MSNPHNLQVGQKLWFVPRETRWTKPTEVEILSVGRKWATTDAYRSGMRVSLESLDADGGDYNSPGRCYLSREAYEVHQRRGATWLAIRRAVGDCYFVPDATTEEMEQAASLLKLQLKISE